MTSLIRDVRSSKIFDSNFDAGRSFDSDFLPSTGMQKSCTASSIADLGESLSLHLLAETKYPGENFFCCFNVLYLIKCSGKERVVKEEKIDFSKKDDEKWKRRSLPAGKVQGNHCQNIILIKRERERVEMFQSIDYIRLLCKYRVLGK